MVSLNIFLYYWPVRILAHS